MQGTNTWRFDTSDGGSLPTNTNDGELNGGALRDPIWKHAMAAVDDIVWDKTIPSVKNPMLFMFGINRCQNIMKNHELSDTCV